VRDWVEEINLERGEDKFSMISSSILIVLLVLILGLRKEDVDE